MIYRLLPILFSFTFFYSCKKGPDTPFIEIRLDENWVFRKVGDTTWLPATVPGDVMTDLFNNQLIDDPFYGTNENSVQWIEKEDWEYRTHFDAPNDLINNERVSLFFNGLDTYADIYLNDSLLLKTDNMFRSWDVPCRKLLKERNNLLLIRFHSAVKQGMSKLKQLDYILQDNHEQALDDERTSVFTRKAAFHYGWDCAPRLVSCGIWRPISIRAWSKAHIHDIYLNPENITTKVADYVAWIDIEATTKGIYQLRFIVDDKEVTNDLTLHLNKGASQEKFRFSIANPNLWWCNGLGNHYLYTLKVQLFQEKELIAEKVQQFGVRQLILRQDSDSIGHHFYFQLNGIPVFIKGANYIPAFSISHLLPEERYKQIIGDAVKTNMNMLRVWGGGIYENDRFYELCDQKGILVWQDFAFAGSMQPGDIAHIQNIQQEAVQNVKRLRNHPCMALWCGNSENMEAWNKSEWKNQYKKSLSKKLLNDYNELFNHILPSVVNENDPKTTYWSSSPSACNLCPPNKKSGDEHEWTVWSEMAPFSAYSDNPGRFVSEYGFQSFPSLKTLAAMDNEDEPGPRSLLMEYRQRNVMPWINSGMNGNQVILDYLQMYYNDPADFESFVYLSQVMQGEALKAGIEAHRSHRPECMGSLYWQFNDCWPTISWSTIDYFGKWKPAQYIVRKSFANLLVIPKRSNGKVNVFVVSDTLADIHADLKITLMDFTGNTIKTADEPIHILPNSIQSFYSNQEESLCSGVLKSKVCLVTQIIIKEKVVSENILYFTDPKYLDLPIPDISFQIIGSSNQFEIAIHADKIAKNVVLDTQEKDAQFSDNNFDLLPNREIRLNVNYSGTREELSNDLKIYTLVDSY
jgi:beta-mannosidase